MVLTNHCDVIKLVRSRTSEKFVLFQFQGGNISTVICKIGLMYVCLSFVLFTKIVVKIDIKFDDKVGIVNDHPCTKLYRISAVIKVII